MFRRRRIEPVPGTPYGVRRGRLEDRVYVRRTTITRAAKPDPGGFTEITEEFIDRWDFVAAQPKEKA